MKKRCGILLCAVTLSMFFVAGCGNVADVPEESSETVSQVVESTDAVVEESIQAETLPNEETAEEVVEVLTAEDLVQLGKDALAAEEPDYQSAYEFFLSASEENNAEACYQLGSMCHNGDLGEVDDAQAMSWYEKAVANGMVEANLGIAESYLWGYGVETDYVKGIEYLDITLTGADPELLGKAMLDKGWLYYNGRGVEQNYKAAYEWFVKGAELGNLTCMGYLGEFYAYGIYVESDYQKSYEWYLKAAEQGYAYGMNVIGYYYNSGLGVERDDEKALEWYRKSAEAGYAQAMENTAFVYASFGVYDEARIWAEKAAENGRDMQGLLDFLPALRY